jgi:hypothetical protein
MAIAEIILEAIRNNELTELNLSHQGLTDQDIFRLCLALNQNTSLTTLNVAGNRIGDAGATALAGNATLTTLNIRANRVGGALRTPSSHTTVRAMSHTAVSIKCLPTGSISLRG